MDRILVGLDASPRAEGVLKVATELARRAGGKLLLFRSVGIPHDVPQEAYSMTPTAVGELLESEAKKYLDKLATALPANLVLGTIVHIGAPWYTICQAAEDQKVDLIVIGSHGYSGIDRLIGTTAAKVVNHAKQSVMVVRAPERI
jgi:universal stress protein F